MSHFSKRPFLCSHNILDSTILYPVMYLLSKNVISYNTLQVTDSDLGLSIALQRCTFGEIIVITHKKLRKYTVKMSKATYEQKYKLITLETRKTPITFF